MHFICSYIYLYHASKSSYYKIEYLYFGRLFEATAQIYVSQDLLISNVNIFFLTGQIHTFIYFQEV